MAELLSLRGRSALSPSRVANLLEGLSAARPGHRVTAVDPTYWHFTETDRPLDANEHATLERLLTYGPRDLPHDECGTLLLVVPRPGTISPWASFQRSAPLAMAILVSGMVLRAAPAMSQPRASATIGTAIDALASAGTSSQTTAAPMVAPSLEHRFADERGRPFYELDAGTFGTPGDWHYQVHNAGASWMFSSASGTRRMYAGGSAWWRANGDSWAAANYRGLGAFTNVEWRPRPTAVLRAGYRFDTRQFPDLAELDQQQHSGFASLLWNLPSRIYSDRLPIAPGDPFSLGEIAGRLSSSSRARSSSSLFSPLAAVHGVLDLAPAVEAAAGADELVEQLHAITP